MRRMDEFFRELFTWGTPQCGFVCGVLGFIIALLLVLVGFFKTLFIVAICAVCAFLGGVGNKQKTIKDFLNGLFPPKGQ